MTLVENLRKHPGTPIAAGLTILGAIAGAERGEHGALIGAAIMSIYWIPVFCTLSGRGE
jgi:hypothetical protein